MDRRSEIIFDHQEDSKEQLNVVMFKDFLSRSFGTSEFTSESAGDISEDSSVKTVYYPKNNEEITVKDPSVRSTRFSKHVTYLIAGSDSSGDFQNKRRYKEFYALRRIMMEQWPGCTVPQLPPKQAIGNLQNEFVESRRKQLEHFLRQIARLSHLYGCDEMQEFLRGPPKFHRSDILTKQINWKLIALRYQGVFSQFSGFQRTTKVEKEIGELLGHLNNGISNLDTLIISCNDTFTSACALESCFIRLVTDINCTKRYFHEKLQEYPIGPTTSNPFAHLIYWCKNNTLSINGLIESIYKQYDLQKLKTKLLSKIDDEKAKIAAIEKGKKKVIQFFNKKPNEFYKGISESEILSLKSNVEDIDTILNLSSALIMFHEFPNFKQQKAQELLAELKNLKESCGDFFQVFIEKLINIDIFDN